MARPSVDKRRWRLCEREPGTGRMIPISEQPADGFPGPGRAFTWCAEHGLAASFGAELFAVRDDGARPRVGVQAVWFGLAEMRSALKWAIDRETELAEGDSHERLLHAGRAEGLGQALEMIDSLDEAHGLNRKADVDEAAGGMTVSDPKRSSAEASA